MFKKLLSLLYDILYPRHCIGCQNEGTLLCERCSRKLDECSATVEHKPNDTIDILIICGDYQHTILRSLITSLKYSGVCSYAENLSKLMIATFEPYIDSEMRVIPIPLHRKKQALRGYNQSQLIAEHFANHFSLSIDHHLKRTVHTRSQSTLTRSERLNNVRNIFSYQGERSPISVVLIDDVATTYATLTNAAQELKKHGTRRVVALVAAKNLVNSPASTPYYTTCQKNAS